MSHGTPVQSVPNERFCQPAPLGGLRVRNGTAVPPFGPARDPEAGSPNHTQIQPSQGDSPIPAESRQVSVCPPGHRRSLGYPHRHLDSGWNSRPVSQLLHCPLICPLPCDQRGLPQVHIQPHSPAPSQPEESSWSKDKETSALRLPGSCPPALS